MPSDLSTLARVEQAAAAQNLGMNIDPMSWGSILAEAQIELGKVLRGDVNSAAQLLHDGTGEELVATARMLDSAVLFQSGGEHPKQTALLAAAAFALKGNFPSATAIVRRTLKEDLSLNETEKVCLATFSLRHIEDVLEISETDTPQRTYLEALNARIVALNTVSDDDVRRLLEVLFSNAEDSFSTMLLGLARVSLEIVLGLSVSSILSQDSIQLPSGYLELLLASPVRALLPPQRQALVDSDFLASNSNALIVLPTSTGKTLLGELAMFSCLSVRDGVSIFVAPYVALASQTFDAIVGRLPKDFEAHAMIGGYGQSSDIDFRVGKHIVVATPEKFDSLLRSNPDIADLIRCVVIDEVHTISNSGRGLRLEGIITRLRMKQSAGSTFRLICLSAVLGDSAPLLNWLGGNAILVQSSWRPTTRRSFLWTLDGELEWMLGDDVIHVTGQRPSTVIASRPLPLPQARFRIVRHPGDLRQQLPMLYTNVSYLVDLLLRQNRGPLLCICSTKASTRNLARSIANRLGVAESASTSLRLLSDLIRERYPYLEPLARCLESRVAYHNAGLPREVRRDIENEARAGNLVAVVSTTTLAEGVDLPFRSTVVVDWLVWDGNEQGAIDPLLFRNLVGRSGRAGYHTEGDTYVIDNPLGGIEIAGSSVRRTNQNNVMFPDFPPSLQSVLQKENFPTQSDGPAVLGSQFLASIPENPRDEDLVTTFLSHSYFYSSSSDHSRLERILSKSRAYILGTESGPLATSASPLRLTQLGQAGNYTGLSPESISAVVDALNTISAEAQTTGGVVSQLLQLLVNIPEMNHQGLQKSFGNRRSAFLVKPDDISTITDLWLSGMDQAQIFMQLPWVLRSKRADSVDEWFHGELPDSTWNDSFDSFVSVVDGVITTFVPWVLRACAYLSSDTGVRQDIDWASIADMVETGTNSPWAASAVRTGIEVSRPTLCAVDLNDVGASLGAPPVFAFEFLQELSLDVLVNAISDFLKSSSIVISIDVREIERLARWIKAYQG